jgi:O-antigen/teichoic acid export membrane protein
MPVSLLDRLRNSRVVRGISANLYSQLVQTALQLLSVPILATHWGLETYGAWLLIATVPTYLAFADFGFAAAAGNDMTHSIARGDRAAAIETFQAVRTAVAGVCLTALGICAAILYSLPDARFAFVTGVSHTQARHAVLLLAAYGFLSIQNNVSMAAFRSIGLYATGTYLQNTIHLAENLGLLGIVILGGDIEAAAQTYVLCSLIGVGVRMLVLRARAHWLTYFSWRAPLAEIRRLTPPALAVIALPMAQAISLQGTVVVVGMAAGPAAVPAFTAVRTLSRLGVQLTTIVNQAVLPEFTMAVASVDHARRARLAFLSLAASAVILTPMLFVILGAGPLILKLWTHGTIHAPYALIVVMAGTMVVNGTWFPISNLIFALNRHSQYSYYYLAAAAAAVLLCYPLVGLFGSPGAAISLLLLDCVMFIRVWMGAMRLEVFDPKEVYDAAIGEAARIRTAIARARARLGIAKPPRIE